jgi:hypothetical protein
MRGPGELGRSGDDDDTDSMGGYDSHSSDTTQVPRAANPYLHLSLPY